MYNKHRLEALSDGIFAIAMTLLILELKVPADVPHGQLWHALRHDSHTWISFVITFAITASFWTLQHRVFDAVESYGAQTLVTTFVFLGFITVLPFSMSLWGQHIAEPQVFGIYFLNQFGIAAALVAKLELARLSGHLRPGVDTAWLRLRLWGMSLIMLTAAICAFILPMMYVAPIVAVFVVLLRLIRWRFLRRHKEPAVGGAHPVHSLQNDNE